MEKVLVAGATGTTGKKIVEILSKSENYQPIAMIRKEEQKRQFEDQGIETRYGDLESNIDHIADNMDKVIFAAGSGGKKVYEVDQEGAKKMVDAGKRAKISKFVMLSSMGADKPEEASELKDYLKAKQNADDYLRASANPYSIVRPGALTDDAGTGKIKVSRSLANSGSISRDDVAKAMVFSLSNDIGLDASFEMVSGETLIQDALNSIS
ncbi:MAG: hypothetical protein ACJA1A_002999 [Saprospiraceae bacterium]|jgi:uncharacterized protein YbjT (DUF2867 family)